MSLAWHFVALNDGAPILRDGRPLPAVGRWLEEPAAVICERGLHASWRAFDALGYSPSGGLPLAACAVEVENIVTEHDDKFVCTRRKALAWTPCDEVLRLFSRQAALSVLHLWQGEVPAVVREYLETGNKEIRAAARDAAWAAARDAAWAAARAAAWAAAISDLNVTLESMLLAEMEYAP